MSRPGPGSARGGGNADGRSVQSDERGPVSGQATRPRPGRGATVLFVVLAVIAVNVLLAPPAPRRAETITPDEDLAQRLRAVLVDLPTDRAPGRPGHSETRAWLAARLGEAGVTLHGHESSWPGRSGGPLLNLEAVLPGQDAAGRIVMVTAHYDTVAGTPGADDNGSGCVVMLEVARRLARTPVSAEVRLVWFDGEERGLLGSLRYLELLGDEELQRIAGVINLECVGYVDLEPGSQRLPPGVRPVFDPGDVGDFILLVSNLDSRAVLQRVAASFRAVWSGPTRVEDFGWVPGKAWVLPDIRRSDHAPFWDAGIPAVLVTDTANFRNPNYHRRSDRADTLDFDFLANVTLGVEQSVRELAQR